MVKTVGQGEKRKRKILVCIEFGVNPGLQSDTHLIIVHTYTV